MNVTNSIEEKLCISTKSKKLSNCIITEQNLDLVNDELLTV